MLVDDLSASARSEITLAGVLSIFVIFTDFALFIFVPSV